MNTAILNAALSALGRQFAAATWRAMPPGQMTATVELLQGLQGLAQEDRLCPADIQQVIVAMVTEAKSQTLAEFRKGIYG